MNLRVETSSEDRSFIREMWYVVADAAGSIRLPYPMQRACEQFAERNRRFVRIGGGAVILSLVLMVIGLLMPRQEPITRDLVLSLPDSERHLLMQEVLAETAAQPDVFYTETRPRDVVPLGVFYAEIRPLGEGRTAYGFANLYQQGEGHLLRLEEFRLTNGPDLRVMLSSAEFPETMEQAARGGVELGALKGNTGNQNFAIPTGTNLRAVRSVVIYSEPFGEIFAAATLMP